MGTSGQYRQPGGDYGLATGGWVDFTLTDAASHIHNIARGGLKCDYAAPTDKGHNRLVM